MPQWIMILVFAGAVYCDGSGLFNFWTDQECKMTELVSVKFFDDVDECKKELRGIDGEQYKSAECVRAEEIFR